jgi:hypothetical protein
VCFCSEKNIKSEHSGNFDVSASKNPKVGSIDTICSGKNWYFREKNITVEKLWRNFDGKFAPNITRGRWQQKFLAIFGPYLGHYRAKFGRLCSEYSLG